MQNREKFSSRLGFILISAGCAIGLGNVYRFPIITGAYGGAFFVLLYLAFLVLLGIPVMCAELANGRASQKSIAQSYDVLEKPGQKWHLAKLLGIGGNYLLMMCYTTIASWMLIYFCKYVTGSISVYKTAEELGGLFGATVSNLPLQLISVAFTTVLCLRSSEGRGTCYKGHDGHPVRPHDRSGCILLHPGRCRRRSEVLSGTQP